MSYEIKTDKILIRDLFNMWFRIPDYQRPYVWGTDQVRDLIDDTMAAMQRDENAQYFLGSLVFKINKNVEITDKTGKEIHYDEYELLDGQQRMITIFLMLAVMRDLVKDDKFKQTCQEFIYKAANVYVGEPERVRFKFDIRGDVTLFIEQHVQVTNGTNNIQYFHTLANDTKQNTSIRNMAIAILTLRNLLKQYDEAQITSYFTFVISNVLVIYIATEDLADAFQLFTVINNRGLKLGNSDILKAENLKLLASREERTFYARRWEEMESYFGDDFDQFLSHIRMILLKRKAVTNLLREFNDYIFSSYTVKQKPLINKGKPFFDFVYNSYQSYSKLLDNEILDQTGDYSIHNYLTLMKKGLPFDYWIAAVLRYYQRFGMDNLKEFLQKLDAKVSADWICSLTPTVRIENVNAILTVIDKAADATEVLSHGDVFMVDRSDLHSYFTGDIYGKRYARYLLLKLDILCMDMSTIYLPSNTISIEHILPQTPTDGSKWKQDFTETDCETWMDKLGNLLLLSRRKNSSQGNADYTEKKNRYFKNNINVFPNSIAVIGGNDSWTIDELQANQDRCLAMLRKAYS